MPSPSPRQKDDNHPAYPGIYNNHPAYRAGYSDAVMIGSYKSLIRDDRFTAAAIIVLGIFHWIFLERE